jgi:hypothetical protein
LLRSSLGLTAAEALARPHVANATATTAEVWWNQRPKTVYSLYARLQRL